MHGVLAFLLTWLVLHHHPVGGHRINRKAEHAESFGATQCLAVVRKVMPAGRYSEESIAKICVETARSSKCDFFAEALALASAHTDFDASRFCAIMGEAHFCSENMDRLLASQPVADLAYGECSRAGQGKDEAYCKRFRSMLSYAVKNDDLDTMRACYMIQAYSGFDGANATQEPELAGEPPASPKMRIITNNGSELSELGYGNATSRRQSNVGRPGIVMQPRVFDYFGTGHGNPLPNKTQGTIIVAPIPADKIPAQLLSGTVVRQQISAPAGSPGNQSRMVTRHESSPPVTAQENQTSTAPLNTARPPAPLPELPTPSPSQLAQAQPGANASPALSSTQGTRLTPPPLQGGAPPQTPAASPAGGAGVGASGAMRSPAATAPGTALPTATRGGAATEPGGSHSTTGPVQGPQVLQAVAAQPAAAVAIAGSTATAAVGAVANTTADAAVSGAADSTASTAGGSTIDAAAGDVANTTAGVARPAPADAAAGAATGPEAGAAAGTAANTTANAAAQAEADTAASAEAASAASVAAGPMANATVDAIAPAAANTAAGATAGSAAGATAGAMANATASAAADTGSSARTNTTAHAAAKTTGGGVANMTAGTVANTTGAASTAGGRSAPRGATANIVTRVVPLAPLVGRLSLHAAGQRVAAAARARAGLAQQGLAKVPRAPGRP